MNKQEFKCCFDDYFDAIRNYLYYRSGDAELSSDIAQDVFMKLWEKQIPFENGRTKSLLYKMAADSFVSHIRKSEIKSRHMHSVMLSFDLENEGNDSKLAERKKYYEEALNVLPEKQRTAFLMNKIEGLTHKEIASRLDLSVKAIEKRISKAFASLRKYVKLLK